MVILVQDQSHNRISLTRHDSIGYFYLRLSMSRIYSTLPLASHFMPIFARSILLVQQAYVTTSKDDLSAEVVKGLVLGDPTSSAHGISMDNTANTIRVYHCYLEYNTNI